MIFYILVKMCKKNTFFLTSSQREAHVHVSVDMGYSHDEAVIVTIISASDLIPSWERGKSCEAASWKISQLISHANINADNEGIIFSGNFFTAVKENGKLQRLNYTS